MQQTLQVLLNLSQQHREKVESLTKELEWYASELRDVESAIDAVRKALDKQRIS